LRESEDRAQRRLARFQRQVEQDKAERDAAVAARQSLLDRLHETEQLRQAAEAHIQDQRHYIQRLEERLNKIYSSTSWRLSAPLRGAGKLLKLPLSPAHRTLTLPHILYYLPGSLLRRVGGRMLHPHAAMLSLARRGLPHAVGYVQQRPRLQSAIRNWVGRFPGVQSRIRSMVLLSYHPEAMPPEQAIVAPARFEAMPPAARTVYANLKHYMAARTDP
jgi:hypothetical protein